MARQSTRPATPVLLTRPEPASSAFAAALRARFGARVRPVVAPLMAPAFLTPRLPPGPFAAVVFTSATGVAAAQGLDLPRRAYCVGAQTTARAEAAGFQAVSADGDAAALVALVLADPPAGRLLHLRGEDTRGEVVEQLNAAGLETISSIVYRQDPQPLTAEARALLMAEAPVILPLFSPRSATLFLAALPQDLRARLHIAAMSAAVAKSVVDLPHAGLVIAERPDAAAMLKAIDRLLEMQPAP